MQRGATSSRRCLAAATLNLSLSLTRPLQIPLFDILAKYDGSTMTDDVTTATRRTYTITRLPKYLVLHLRRFKVRLDPRWKGRHGARACTTS